MAESASKRHYRYSFGFLNAVQFLDALNENLFKLIVAYFLIYLQGEPNTSSIMALIGALFVLPFVLFSSLGGIFADKWSKTKVIQATKVGHFVVALFALVAVVIKGVFMIYLAVFLMATVSAIFGPSKYGIIAELVPSKKILYANSMIAAFTFFGIIIGTFLASLLDMLAHQVFYLMISACILVSVLGAVLSFIIQPTPALNKSKKASLFFYQEIYLSLVQMRDIPHLGVAVFGYSYFLLIGAFVQMNIVPFSVSVLKMSPIVGGYLFIFSAVGMGVGALVASKMSGNLSILPKSGVGISVGLFLFWLFPNPYWLNVIWLLFLGVLGGLFLVPAQAFILTSSPLENRGQFFGTANFLSFVFAIVAAALIYLLNSLWGMEPSVSFAILAVVNLLVSCWLFYSIKKLKPVGK